MININKILIQKHDESLYDIYIDNTNIGTCKGKDYALTTLLAIAQAVQACEKAGIEVDFCEG